MYSKLVSVILVVLFTGCAVKMKNKKSDAKVVAIKKLEFRKPNNWADKFYKKTSFIVRNPKVLNSYEQLESICKGDEFDFVTDYTASEPYPIKFKKGLITIQTQDGFSKKVFVTKGVCREFALLKAPKTSADGNIRINIKELNILYIYNYGSYVEDVTFRTAFKDVEFYVK